MKKYLLLTTLLLFVQFSFGQDLLTKQAPLPCLNKQFSVAAHLVRSYRDTTEVGVTVDQIKEGIASLKEFFDPICVSFSLCSVDTIDNHLYDLLSNQDWEEMQTQYNEDYRINMYFVTASAIDPNACGFANLNGINAYKDGGIVILKDNCVNPSTFSHEMGHYFNLLHTFTGNGVELVNGDNCSTHGDLVCDTPADPYDPENTDEKYFDSDCIFVSSLKDANGEYYRPDVGNIMSYYPCSCGFTYEQYIRMAKAAKSSDTW